MNSLSNVAIAASSLLSLLLVLTGVALVVMLALLLQRTRVLREMQTRQEQQLLSLETLRGVVDSLAQHTREHQHHVPHTNMDTILLIRHGRYRIITNT